MTVRYLRSIRSRQGVYPSPNATSYGSDIPARFVPEPTKSKIMREFNSRISSFPDPGLRTIPSMGPGPAVTTTGPFPYFLGPMGTGPMLRPNTSTVKREPTSTANSNDSGSDSDCAFEKISEKSPNSNTQSTSSQQTWRPWWNKKCRFKNFTVRFFFCFVFKIRMFSIYLRFQPVQQKRHQKYRRVLFSY